MDINTWLVVGVSGVTNGGKTTLTTNLMESLPPNTRLLRQDDYFLEVDSPKHVLVEGLDNHFNWDTITCLNMEKMNEDIREIISSSPSSFDNNLHETEPAAKSRPILLIEGFLLFDDHITASLCESKYFFTLDYALCLERRLKRCYEPPDIPGYFDLCVWPMYNQYIGRVKANIADVCYLDGSVHLDTTFRKVSQEIINLASF